MPRAKTPASPGVVPGKVKKKGQGQAIQTAASMSTSASSSASTAATASSNAPPPAWPPFKPALPVTDLLPEPLEQCPDKVVLLPNFWPKSLCNTFVAFLRGLALETTPGGRPKRNMAARVNDRFQVDDPAFARRLWLGTGLRDALQREDVRALWGGDVVGLNSNIRVYRYTKGQYFDAHYDDSNNVVVPADDPSLPPIPCITTWTLLLYLTTSSDSESAGCIGGETVFFPHDRRVSSEEISVPPLSGLLLLHKHGKDCMLHEGRQVTAGEKWILRTDICVRR
ncbi:hypothetical protein VD0002_g255 [Verticillium dahliae]|uniref:Fe2OG dioxygenase domain-containing protein n=1 Tax=Verticillium dahliae TaxID=27337 RepID=A0AA45AIE9_VERDA|nr:hypothetical protein BJF96_g8791 [Verticillium dahliae]PNH44362.1 hypothetical protein VD0004_g3274 [Verticillium dahliae]PNH55462.1 hypothetical protein VD0003_g2129 [Verticillium dahliae]PNH70428.1 hypothetical protein VD0002_g255 [Verticillium dahliae]